MHKVNIKKYMFFKNAVLTKQKKKSQN